MNTIPHLNICSCQFTHWFYKCFVLPVLGDHKEGKYPLKHLHQLHSQEKSTNKFSKVKNKTCTKQSYLDEHAVSY